MKRTYAWRDGALVEITPTAAADLHYVADDIPEFQSPDGAVITGRARWREHLKRTGAVEMGHADIREAQGRWTAKREAFQRKLQANAAVVHEVEPPSGDIQPSERSAVSREVANRLHNRPAPDRKTLLKIALETARYLAGRR